jgi:thiamine phosphate synthase YjbQ (UPF0047 family)
MEDLIYAKLVTIEKLLEVLLSDTRYAELLRQADADIHTDYGSRLNQLFPSDPEYQHVNAIYSNFKNVLSSIELNATSMGRTGESGS